MYYKRLHFTPLITNMMSWLCFSPQMLVYQFMLKLMIFAIFFQNTVFLAFNDYAIYLR